MPQEVPEGEEETPDNTACAGERLFPFICLLTHQMQTRYSSGLSTALGLEEFTGMKFHISVLVEFAFLEAGETHKINKILRCWKGGVCK